MAGKNLSVFPTGEKNEAYARWFTGQSYLQTLTGQGLPVANVTFEPGCRNSWHIHHAESGGGQILLCTAGYGWYQEWGQEPRALHPGDTVTIAPGVKHWHGAAKDCWFQHLAIEVPGEGCGTEWLEPVSDESYGALPASKREAPRQTAGRDALGVFAPKFAELNDDVLFGEVWSRTQELSLRDRSVVTVVSLTAQGLVDESFRYHLRTAKQNGVTADEMAEILTHAAFYAGWPKAWAAFRMAKEVYAEP